MPKHFIFSQRLADILHDAATHDLVDVMKVKKHLEVEKSGNPVFRNGKLQFSKKRLVVSCSYKSPDL